MLPPGEEYRVDNETVGRKYELIRARYHRAVAKLAERGVGQRRDYHALYEARGLFAAAAIIKSYYLVHIISPRIPR